VRSKLEPPGASIKLPELSMVKLPEPDRVMSVFIVTRFFTLMLSPETGTPLFQIDALVQFPSAVVSVVFAEAAFPRSKKPIKKMKIVFTMLSTENRFGMLVILAEYP